MDNNVVTDWRSYFASLPSGSPVVRPDITPTFEGAPKPSVTFVKGLHGELEVTLFQLDEENLFDRVKEVWETEDGPEMWVFFNTGSPPWHADARPKTKKKGK